MFPPRQLTYLILLCINTLTFGKDSLFENVCQVHPTYSIHQVMNNI